MLSIKLVYCRRFEKKTKPHKNGSLTRRSVKSNGKRLPNWNNSGWHPAHCTDQEILTRYFLCRASSSATLRRLEIRNGGNRQEKAVCTRRYKHAMSLHSKHSDSRKPDAHNLHPHPPFTSQTNRRTSHPIMYLSILLFPFDCSNSFSSEHLHNIIKLFLSQSPNVK